MNQAGQARAEDHSARGGLFGIRPLANAADHRACHAAIRGGSRSFSLAAALLPAELRRDALALYAFCRLADDAVDHCAGDSTAAVAKLTARLHAAAAGQPADASADRALADAIARHRLPSVLPLALIEGFAWDAAGFTPRDESELLAYAVRVAGSVGVMMAVLMGVRDAPRLARAADLGIAMQLTNIARDVGEDAAMGRLYLPHDWLRAAGIAPEAFLARPRHSPGLARVVADLLALAEKYYERAAPGIAALPWRYRPAIAAASSLYREIGRTLARSGGNPLAGRTITPAWRRNAVLAKAAATSAVPRPWPGGIRRAHALPACAQARFLIDAVPGLRQDSGNFADRVLWAAEILSRRPAQPA